jgi:hypothetical protein
MTTKLHPSPLLMPTSLWVHQDLDVVKYRQMVGRAGRTRAGSARPGDSYLLAYAQLPYDVPAAMQFLRQQRAIRAGPGVDALAALGPEVKARDSKLTYIQRKLALMESLLHAAL